MIDTGLQAMKGVSDLNAEGRLWQFSCFSVGRCHEHRKTLFAQLMDISPGRPFIAWSIDQSI
jgi:hypothetical protein